MIGLLAVLVPVVGLIGCNKPAAQAGRGTREGVAVKAVTLQRISVQRKVELSGTLLSLDQAKVSSEAAGVVRAVPIQIGSEVQAGDVLVQLDEREAKFALDRAESSLRQTEAQLGINGTTQKDLPADDQIAAVRQAAATRDDARANLARVERLMARGLLAQADLETAQTKFKVADATYQSVFDSSRSLKASLQDRRASYELAKKKLADTAIKAPVTGLIADRLVQVGEYILLNAPVAVVVQVNPLKLKTALQERYAGLISPGLSVTFRVESFPKDTFEGQVAYVSPAIDQATRTFVVEALVENKDRRLKPGFFAKGTLTTQLDANVIAVSEDAVATLAGVSSVFVIEDGKIRQQQVTLGGKQGKAFEIVEGLKGNEVLAGSSLSNLATGTPVRAGEGDAGAAAGATPAAGASGPGGKAGGGEGRSGGGRRGGRSGQRGGQQ
ncbi:MAG: efflux RND transporter periplasmic adaptor subunit [Acidobacteriota bacterium]